MAENITVDRGHSGYPARLVQHLRDDAPLRLWAVGNWSILAHAKVALFCSARCPGSAILRVYDQVAKWRDEGRCVISGFHSETEKESLRILLRGKCPVILLPARSLPAKIPSDWRAPLAEHRMLVVSAFDNTRPTNETASRRNVIAAALADEVWFAHVCPGGKAEALSKQVSAWGLPVHFANQPDTSVKN